MVLSLIACFHGIIGGLLENQVLGMKCVCVCVDVDATFRSKRNRQGPVIEADGMLKMFHCPYEGCSQVYVALSSYQVSTMNATVVLHTING